MVPAGPRASTIENTTQRLLGEIQGAFGEWDYKVNALYSDSNVKNNFEGGYVSRPRIIDGIQGNNGAPYLNPFGDQIPQPAWITSWPARSSARCRTSTASCSTSALR